MKEKFLLQICCAPCAAHVIEVLKEEYQLALYFYNPNIHPTSEYKKRLKEIEEYAKKSDIPFLAGGYDVEEWFTLTKGHEDDPERGERCEICYRMRLEKTAAVALGNDCSWFGTTLTISPHKDADVINNIGQEIAIKQKINFYQADFKKDDGFKKSMVHAKEHVFYRQNYCGCLYSKAD